MKTESRTVEIRLSETDPERMGPGRLVGTLMPYETRAVDRAEMFKAGALHWPEDGRAAERSCTTAGSPYCAVHSRSYRNGGSRPRWPYQLPDTTARQGCGQ